MASETVRIMEVGVVLAPYVGKVNGALHTLSCKICVNSFTQALPAVTYYASIIKNTFNYH